MQETTNEWLPSSKKQATTRYAFLGSYALVARDLGDRRSHSCYLLARRALTSPSTATTAAAATMLGSAAAGCDVPIDDRSHGIFPGRDFLMQRKLFAMFIAVVMVIMIEIITIA